MWLGFAARQGDLEAKNNLATMHAQRGQVDQAAEIWADQFLGHGYACEAYVVRLQAVPSRCFEDPNNDKNKSSQKSNPFCPKCWQGLD